MPFLKLDNLSKYYPGVTALDEVDIELNKGEVHALVGENGAGKSTLIKCIAGVEIPESESEIYIKGKAINFTHPLESVQEGIAVTFQDFNLFPNLSVAENIALGKKIEEKESYINWKEINQIAREVMQRLNIDININTQFGDLSVGNQQLVAIARAIVHDAELIILDEPTSSLSREEIDNLYEIIEMLRNNNIGVLFVSHKLDEVYEVGDKVTVLRDGKDMGTHNLDEISEEELISLMVGREVRFKQYENREPGAPLLEVEGLNKKGYYQDISFSLYEGEILGITGLVGAGRSELAQSIFGNYPPDSGMIRLEDREIVPDSINKMVEQGIAYVPEDRDLEGLFPDKTVSNNIAVTNLDKLSNNWGYINKKDQNSLVQEWMDRLGIIPKNPEKKLNQLSGGNEQKVLLAKWLSYNPKILIVDEPTSGIDVGAKEEIHELLRNLSAQGIGVIVISSEFPEILAISDRIITMKKGRFTNKFENKDITQEDLLSNAI